MDKLTRDGKRLTQLAYKQKMQRKIAETQAWLASPKFSVEPLYKGPAGRPIHGKGRQQRTIA